jgi:NAD+ kinase
MERLARIGLVANPTKASAGEWTRELFHTIQRMGGAAKIESATAKEADLPGGQDLVAMAAEVDVIVVLGGDGTILRTARALGADQKPLASVNLGNLGFLTTATCDEASALIGALLHRQHRISIRRTLEATFVGRDGTPNVQTALNDAVVSRGAISHMVKLDVSVDGEFLNRYSGDGLIVSTPTGSTAYNLAAGGPIVSPNAAVFCVTPICSHALANRAVVVEDSASIEIRPTDEDDELLLSMDGCGPWSLGFDRPVTLRRGAWEIPLVALEGQGFYPRLRQKFQWRNSSI